MASLVYGLCALTSAACAVLLLRSYAAQRERLLLWSGLCFTGLVLNNVLLFVDLIVMPGVDLSLWRNATGAGALLLLLFSLIWDHR